MNKVFLLIVFVIALTLPALGQNTKTLVLPKPTPAPPDPTPGNIELIYGYTHTKKRGIDTSVGEISKPNGMVIRYDNGALAGIVVSQECGAKDACQWYKLQKINGREVWLGLTKDGRIYASFPKEYANFYAQTKSPEDIADFLIMILTYKVKEEATIKNKTEAQKPKPN